MWLGLCNERVHFMGGAEAQEAQNPVRGTSRAGEAEAALNPTLCRGARLGWLPAALAQA